MINPFFMEAKFFKNKQTFRSWLLDNYNKCQELWVGYYKKGTGKPSISYPESVDEALCFGWIDGLKKSIDDERYMQRFTPRKSKSNWSDVNTKRMETLIKEGLAHPNGIKVFESRDKTKPSEYSFEQENIELKEAYLKQLQAHPIAWEYFQSTPKSYQKPAIWWIISAKTNETREKRLQILLECSEKGEKVPPLNYGKK